MKILYFENTNLCSLRHREGNNCIETTGYLFYTCFTRSKFIFTKFYTFSKNLPSHITPLPVNPELHVHVKPGLWSVQAALVEQLLFAASAHSSISVKFSYT